MIGSWSWTFTNLKLKRICTTLSKVNLVAGSVSLAITRFTAGDKRKQVSHWHGGFICFSRRWRGRSLRFGFFSSARSTLTQKDPRPWLITEWQLSMSELTADTSGQRLGTRQCSTEIDSLRCRWWWGVRKMWHKIWEHIVFGGFAIRRWGTTGCQHVHACRYSQTHRHLNNTPGALFNFRIFESGIPYLVCQNTGSLRK